MENDGQLVSFVRNGLESEAVAGTAVHAAIAAYARRRAFRRRLFRRLPAWVAAAALAVACVWSVQTVRLTRGDARLRAALALFDAGFAGGAGDASAADLVLAFQDAPSERALAAGTGDAAAL